MSVLLLTSALVGWSLGMIPAVIAYVFIRVSDASSYV